MDSKIMAPPSLKKPAMSAFKAPPSVLRAAAAGGGSGPGRGGPARGIPITGRTGGRGPPNTVIADGLSAATAASASDGTVGPPAASAGSAAASFGVAASSSGSIFSRHDGRPIEDEYDPMRPNDYEEVMIARERARKAAEAEAERQAKLKEAEAEAERLRKQEEERARSAAAASGSGGGGEGGGGGGGGVMSMEEYARRRAAMGMTGDDAFARRGGRGGGAPPGPPGMGGGGGGGGMGAPGAGGGDDGSGYKGMTLAQKLLEKMGWREGEGLGKNRQGISNPLVAQKTNQRAGVIVEAPPVPSKQPLGGGAEAPEAKRLRGAVNIGAPSRVICMRNMVGPGHVDEELEEEVGQELTKYGKVLDVLIFEVTTPGYQEEEAVRIFVLFERQENATKAVVDLQGRFFAGRSVRVTFFPEERFTSTDLAPKQGEFD